MWAHSSAGRAPALQAGGHRFEPYCAHHLISYFAGVAQLAEQLICNQQVAGSSPITSSIFGGIPEWPKGADCKSVVTDFDGSNPSPPTKRNGNYHLIIAVSFLCQGDGSFDILSRGRQTV